MVSKVYDTSTVLVNGVISGDRRAEAKLVDLCANAIRSTLSQLTSQAADADDLFQEAVIVLLKQVRAGNIREPERIVAYARSVARNQFLMECRKNNRWNQVIAREVYGDNESVGSLIDKQYELSQAINIVWNQLTVPRDKSVLLDVLTSGKPKSELIAKYDMKPEHLDRVVHRARCRFKSMWQREFNSLDICC